MTPLGERGPTLQLKLETELLKAPKAVHDPIVLLDQLLRNVLLVGDNLNKLFELLVFMQERIRYARPLR
jgi:hypothetical protein